MNVVEVDAWRGDRPEDRGREQGLGGLVEVHGVVGEGGGIGPLEGREEELLEQLIVPSFDSSVLDGKILDAREGDRVLLQRETLDPLLEYTDSFYSAHFLALDVQPLLGEARAQLESEPEAHRAKPFFIRGWIEEVEKRAGREGEGEFHGRLLLEDKSFAHFITKAMPVGAIIGDFIRFDGLFLKLFR